MKFSLLPNPNLLLCKNCKISPLNVLPYMVVHLECILNVQVLIKEYKALTNQAPKGIPKSIVEYYSTLAKFSWDCVARPIPLIMSTDYTKFDKEMHETREAGDDDDDNEGKDVSYIYPVLLTSNNWPREVALKGKVIILPTN